MRPLDIPPGLRLSFESLEGEEEALLSVVDTTGISIASLAGATALRVHQLCTMLETGSVLPQEFNCFFALRFMMGQNTSSVWWANPPPEMGETIDYHLPPPFPRPGFFQIDGSYLTYLEGVPCAAEWRDGMLHGGLVFGDPREDPLILDKNGSGALRLIPWSQLICEYFAPSPLGVPTEKSIRYLPLQEYLRNA